MVARGTMTSSRQRRRRRRLLFHRFRKNRRAGTTLSLISVQVDDQEPIPIEATLTVPWGPGPIGLTASWHGVSRLRRRGISPHEIPAVLADPEIQATTFNDRRVLYGTTPDQRRLKLVVGEGGVVITASDRDVEE
jgi:hypothetical protein